MHGYCVVCTSVALTVLLECLQIAGVTCKDGDLQDYWNTTVETTLTVLFIIISLQLYTMASENFEHI